MGHYSLHLFGPMQLTDPAGRPLRVPPGKLQGLLAYLAYRPGHQVERGELAELLWGERPAGQARHSLSQALTMLRKAVGPIGGPVAGDPEMLALDAARVDVDVARFRELAEQASEDALERARRLYDEPLAGLDVAEQDFEDWLTATRAELRELAVRVYEDLLAHVLAADDPDRAICVAGELLRIEPACEAGHRALIATYAAQGDSARAIEQYHICHRRLRDELGVTPNPETEELLRSLRAWRRNRVSDTNQGSASAPTILLAPVTRGGSVDHALLGGVLGDFAAVLKRFRPVQANLGATSNSDDAASRLAELSAERSLDYGLGVSLYRIGDKTCLEATLVRAADAAVVWRAAHEFGLGEIFDPGVIAAPVTYHVERDWVESAKAIPEEEWSAYTHFLRGAEIYFISWDSPDTSARALRYFERAVSLGLELTQARARRDSIRADPVLWPGRDDLDEFTAAFMESAERALVVDPAEPSVHRMMGLGYLHLRRFDAAHWHLSRGLRDNPSDADLNAAYARFLTHVGEPRRGLAAIRRAQRLNPIHPDYFWEQLALPLYALGHYEEALAALRQMRHPSYYEHLYMAACQSGLEEHAAARRSLEQALTAMPDLRLSAMDRLLPYREPTLARRIGSHLRAAGLPR